MISILKQPTAPNSGLDISNIRVHLGLFDDDSIDDYINSLVLAAEQTASDYLGFPIGETTYQFLTTSFTNQYIDVAGQVEMTSLGIEYKDVNGDIQELPINNYVAEVKAGQINLSFVGDLPELDTTQYPITFFYSLKLQPALRSSQMQQAIMLYVGDMYANKANTTTDATNKIPLPSQRLLDGIAIPRL